MTIMVDEKQQSTKRHRSEHAMDDSSATVLKRLRTMKMKEFLRLETFSNVL
jgi:hypothetical protein